MAAMETVSQPPAAERSTFRAILRGITLRCPHCGEGSLFRSYLKATDSCDRCGESFRGMRTDDAAPWLTIVVVGHIIAPLILISERLLSPPTWVQMTLWSTMALVLTLLVLPRSKGAILGIMWAKGLRGDETH